MSFTRRTLITIGLIVVLVVAGCLLYLLSAPKEMSFTAQSQAVASSTASSTTSELIAPRPTQLVDGINFEISSTTAQQEQGLGDRAVIPDNYGMLFVFPQDEAPGFWMKDMLAPLDMIWLSDNGTIVSVTPSIAADTYPEIYYPPSPIRYVLETKAGFAAEKGWVVGTHVQLPLPYGE